MNFKFVTRNIRQSGRKGLAFLSLLAGSTGTVYAQTGTTPGKPSPAGMGETEMTVFIALCLMLVVTLLALIVCLYTLHALKLILKPQKAPAGQPAGQKAAAEGSLWGRLNRRFGAGEVIPVGLEEEIMMDHAYDGISELNNHMPPWLKYLFYGTMAFAAVYISHYLVLGTGTSQMEEYREALADAEKLAEERKLLANSSIDESNVTLVTDTETLAEARALFEQNCTACHGKDGGGMVGPNLTDEYWLHGGSVQDVFKVIKYGVQEKGMIPWQGKLNPEEIQNVASFILSLQGTTPENPKAPQGEKYVREEAGQTVTSSSL